MSTSDRAKIEKELERAKWEAISANNSIEYFYKA
jgi:hypothetical protein